MDGLQFPPRNKLNQTLPEALKPLSPNQFLVECIIFSLFIKQILAVIDVA